LLNSIVRTFQYGQHTITLETGMMARQATSSIMITMDDTSVFITIVGCKKVDANQKYFPLSINYQERAYAAGRIPGGFFRREGRPSENEILIARLIDRPLRPLFPQGFYNEIQITATVVSVNPQVNPDIVAMIGVSTALQISGIPFLGPVGTARVGYINNQYILNPTTEQMKITQLDLIISGTKDSILMVEAEVNLLNEQEILNAIIFGHQQQQTLIENIILFSKDVKMTPWEYIPVNFQDHILFSIILNNSCQINPIKLIG